MIERIRNRLAAALDEQGAAKAIRTHSNVAVGSSVGLVRKRNEDCCLVVRGSYAKTNRGEFTAAIVCDGLGGMSQGREAAALAASAFAAHLFCSTTPGWEVRLSRAIAYANHEVYRHLQGDGGTTLSAVVVPAEGEAILCHVGDSRIYGLSPERILEQLSRDDTINALLNKGDREADAAKDSRLLQFVGMGDEMEAQIAPIAHHVRSILITSDGAHDIPSSVLQRMVSAAAGGNDLVRKLLTLSDMLGGRDNASAILLPLGGEADLHTMGTENELLAVLPGETLSICVAGSDTFERSARIDPRFAQHTSAPSQSSRPRDPVVPPTTADEAAQSEPDPRKPKDKTRTRKSKQVRSRSKPDGAARLPLDEPRHEVDVQISSPSSSAEDEEDKK